MSNNFTKDYPIVICRMVDTKPHDEYYFAYLPDFGHSACSAVGDTPKEALESLEEIKEGVILYYLETGKELPTPTNLNLFPSKLDWLKKLGC